MLKKLFLDLNNFKPNLGSIERGDSIEINIKLLNDEDYSRSKFRVLGTKADGKYVEQIEGINLEEKDLKVILEDQFVNCEGIVKLELNVVSGETEITTKEFYFFVSNTMNAEIIDSADSIPTLEKVSKYVDDAVDNLEALKGASEDITIINSEFKENEIKRKANEMLREKNEKARLQSEDIRITGEEERKTNELERIQAENDRKVSESNRKLAENTRKTNEAARVEAELNRQSLFEANEEIRNSNENLRIASEKERIKFNSEAKTDELNRKEAEKNRVLAEEERKSSEESRVAAEAIRQNTYTDFNESEEERKNNEIKRQEAEALRVEAETRRDNLFSEKEEERNTSFIESEKVRNAAFNKAQDSRNTTFEESETVREEAFKISEKARNDAEELRVTAESERVKSEKLRVDSEKARVLAEEERNTTFTQKEEERNNTFTQNETNRNDTFTQSEEERQGVFEEVENARKVAESKRVKTESSRVEAEKLRVSAETGRVEAENLRVTAEEERVAAETKREEGFNAFEGRISANTKELKAARSATTGEEFNSLDERIDHEVDRLNKKIDVTMLQQEDKESHTIEDSVYGMSADFVIKGKTLQNVIKMSDFSLRDIGTLEGTTFKINRSSSTQLTAIALSKKFLPLLKSNTVYTVLAKIENNTLNGDFSLIHSYQNTMFTKKPVTIPHGFNGFVAKTFTTIEDVSLGDRMEINFQLVTGTVDIKNLIILEGDYTNIFIDEYFEGVKSFGQKEEKVSILSHGKNLININSFEVVDTTGSMEIKKTTESISVKMKKAQGWTTAGVFKIKVKPNTDYILGRKINVNVYGHDESTWGCGLITIKENAIQNARSLQEVGNPSREFPTGSGENIKTVKFNTGNCNYIGVFVKPTTAPVLDNQLSDFIISDLFLYESNTDYKYKPYKEDKKDILLSQYGFDEGLRGFTLSICDKFNSINGVVTKRIGKYIFSGNENINKQSEASYTRFVIDNIPNAKRESRRGHIIHSKVSFLNDGNKPNGGFMYNGSFFFYINNDSADDIETAKELIRGTELYYELSEPVETPLSENINLKTFGERTYIGFENSISGASSFKAPVDSATTISRLNRENRALEEENRSLRQDFESTTLSLTDSDLELVKQNVDMDFRLMEVEFALDIPQAILSSNIKFKNKKGEVKSMARTPYEMMKIVILSGDYDREDYMHKVGKYYERGRMTKEEHDELMSLMTADEVISK